MRSEISQVYSGDYTFWPAGPRQPKVERKYRDSPVIMA